MSQLRDRGFEHIEAVVERQQRVLTKGDDTCFLLHRQNRRPWRLRPGRKIGYRATLAPLGYRLGVDAVPPSQRSQALLTMLLDGLPLSLWCPGVKPVL